ncbi:MAG: biotin/lipoate protein ligase [Verrucomicrobiales bacterium]|nr:biotin/lipoate protein ligase [Verrucomicrobiales bacterium]
MSETWLLWKCGKGAAAENMAIDAVLLERVAEVGRPILRLYGWSEPAATFGYFQKFSEVAALTTLRPLVRRPTGGGLVPHDADWTYSLVFPPSHPWYELKAIESYRRVHAWIQSAFLDQKVKTELAPLPRHEAVGQCFIGAEQNDVLFEGKKIAGGAQRRNRHGLLVQGSIQPPSQIRRIDWEKSFCDFATRNWNVHWQDFQPSEPIFEAIAKTTFDQFSRDDYNQKR